MEFKSMGSFSEHFKTKTSPSWHDLTVGVYRGNRKTPQVAFSIRRSVAEKAGWGWSDYADVEFDPATMVGRIIPLKSSNRRSRKLAAKPSRGDLKFFLLMFPLWPGCPVPIERGVCEDVTVRDDEIWFKFPEGTTIFKAAEE